MYYFAGVISLNESFFPVFQMHTSMHDSATIASCLLNFRSKYVKKGGQWPPFKTVVTDCSWAMINAVILAFNNTNVEQYIEELYEIAYGNGIKPRFVVLKLCAVHFFKKICEKLKEHYQKKKIRDFLKSVTVKLINSESFSEFHFYAINLLRLLDTKYLDGTTLKAYRNVRCKDPDLVDLPEKIFSDSWKGKTLYSRSKFYLHFCEKLVSSNEFIAKKNTLHSPEFADYLRKIWLPYCPMWSSFISGRVTNNLVETYFKHIKIDLFRNDLRNKAGRVVRTINDFTQAKFNSFVYNFPAKKVKTIQDDDLLNTNEMWDSKSKSKNWFYNDSGNQIIYLINFIFNKF